MEKKQVRVGLGWGELIKSYGFRAFVFGSVTRFFNHQLYTNPGSLVRDGLAAAGRTGMTAAFRTPLFICIERSMAASRGGQSDNVNFIGAVFASYLAVRLPAGAFLTMASQSNRFKASLATILPIPITPRSTLHMGVPGAGGLLYWCFLRSLTGEHYCNQRNIVLQDHGFNPGFLQDFC